MKSASAVIVEDDDSTARQLALLLGTLGYSCDICSDGKIAMERLNENLEANVIVVDIQLPFVTGIDLLAEIERNQFYKDALVIVVTVDYNLAYLVKNTPVLIKPIGLNDLISVIGFS